MSIIDYNLIFSKSRFLEEKSSARRSLESEFSSDKSRIIFSSAFRRLQQKAQVFSLETNAAVRSRLTHTLEVTNTGSQIAKLIIAELSDNNKALNHLIVPFIDITETCCLLHDIGNPPFGHFGEAAIQKWFNQNWSSVYDKSIDKLEKSESKTLMKERYINDFLKFDGNPQTIRIILHLQGLPKEYNKEEYKDGGFNLTYSQILSSLKYTKSPTETTSGKPGFFHCEEHKINEIRSKLNWSNRFPITYIMEAADDISYCLSDIEDGIEKNIFSPRFFFEEIKSAANENLKAIGITYSESTSKHDFFKFKIELTRNLINIAKQKFIENQELIKIGECSDLLKLDENASKILKELKNFAVKNLFRSNEAEKIELAGHKVILGLLDAFKSLLELKETEFSKIIEQNYEYIKENKLDLELRLFNRLPQKYINAYRYAIDNKTQDSPPEWYFRAHLIVDYISGMTDNFALETYKLLNGIEI